MLREASSNTKPASRCIGIDDGPFPPETDDTIRYAPLLAVWLKGPHLHQFRAGWITVDGLDATRKAEHLLKGSTHTPVLLSGVTFGGFNLIDPWKIQKLCKAPVIVVVGSRPDNRAVKRALTRHFPDWKRRWDLIRSLGPIQRVRAMIGEGPLFFERFGCSTREARLILKTSAFVSRVPEPLRVAGVLARGLFFSEPSG
ncbi:MAG TPA: DUF99 family protein [Candidatus Bathyarchaeia archaeon]|nr:DUF99 family protein [Candidatus Bathyarchaeia archaeon]